MSFLRKAMFFGLGLLTVTKEAAEKLVDELVEKGEMSQDEAKKFVEEAIRKGEEQREEIKDFIRKEIDKLKSELGLASKAEMDDIRNRITELEKKIQG